MSLPPKVNVSPAKTTEHMFDCHETGLVKNPVEETVGVLDGHIVRSWELLSDQSKKRLECLAVSVGVGVTPEAHAELAGAFELIAETEGTLERETEFAQYLGDEAVCSAVARGRMKRGSLSMAARGQKQRSQTDPRAETRFEKVREQMAIAIDGEGVTLEDGSHVYRYMAASLSDGTVLDEIDREDGITTREALDFVAGLPAKFDASEYADRGLLGIFGYGLGYDQCKWLEGLTNKQLFELFHAEDLEPKAKLGPYRLVMLGKCLQITNKKGASRRKRILVWDILKAFQATFVNALRTWKVGTEREWQRIEDMKKKRGDFANQSWFDVIRYCKDECRLLAGLVEKYVRAHCDAGIDLRGKFHGAGSTGDAFLKLMNAEEKRCTVKLADDQDYRGMRSAWSRAFFGGRSEISRLGVVPGPLHTYDIGSAYPHAIFSLPCLKHGKWYRVERPGSRTLRAARAACVRYEVRRASNDRLSEENFTPEEWEKVNARSLVLSARGIPSRPAWGALPYRTDKSSIVFPTSGPGGWAWHPEFEVAQKHWPGVVAIEAWVHRGECTCESPWKAIGEYYLKRLEWGKEGPGLVLKLGLNSCYGKFAQVIGKTPKYSCRVVAGVITATTRARILEAIASAKDPWSVVYVATDGIVTDAPIDPPDPEPNETAEGARAKGKAMLGAWEHEEHDDEYFIVQPGWYFSTDLTKPMSSDVTNKIRAKAKSRGMPLEVVERGKILEQWRRAPLEPPTGLPKRSVFRGVKQSILRPTKTRSEYIRKPSYGRWEEEERELKYVVNPKRSHPQLIREGVYRLLTWELAMDQPISAEYKKDPGHGEAHEYKDDQPDFDESAGTNVGE